MIKSIQDACGALLAEADAEAYERRSRNQIVLNALRSRRIAGNKSNRSSMSATMSRLKSAGVAEDYGKKIRLTLKFLDEWNASRGGG